MKTADLIGPALNWAVAQCEGKVHGYKHQLVDDCRDVIPYTPSSDWSQGGPIIEREWIELGAYRDQWRAVFHGEDGSIFQVGPTPLIAAMRCYVASRLGDEVDVPDELV